MVVHAQARMGQAMAAAVLVVAGVWAVVVDLRVPETGNIVAEAGIPVPGFLALGGMFAVLVGVLILTLRRG